MVLCLNGNLTVKTLSVWNGSGCAIAHVYFNCEMCLFPPPTPKVLLCSFAVYIIYGLTTFSISQII
jgi:hypothetical protein